MTQTQTNHTPGPWRISDGDQRSYIAVETHQYRSVARIPPGANDLANARLIAAAPDLLAALNLVSVDKDGDGFICAEGMEYVRAAIRKATGSEE